MMFLHPAIFLHLIRLAIAILAAVYLSGCAQIPQAELTQYKQAFSQAQNAAETVLLDYDRALKESRDFMQSRTPAQNAKGPYLLVWDEVATEFDGKPPGDIEVRRLAFKVVGDYNNVLTALAEGKSIEQVRTSAGGLLKSIDQLKTTLRGTGIAGLTPLTGIISTLAELVEKARLREEFVEAVEKGGPVVDQLLATLSSDIKSHYDLRAALLNRERIRIVAGMRDEQETVSTILSRRNVPAKEVGAIETQLNEFLLGAKAEIAVYPVKLPSGGSKAPEYSAMEQAQLQAELREVGRLAKQYQANLEAARAIRAALADYRRMLDKTRQALAVLEKSLHAPVDMTAGANEVFDIAFSLRRNLAAFRAANAGP